MEIKKYDFLHQVSKFLDEEVVKNKGTQYGERSADAVRGIMDMLIAARKEGKNINEETVHLGHLFKFKIE